MLSRLARVGMCCVLLFPGSLVFASTMASNAAQRGVAASALMLDDDPAATAAADAPDYASNYSHKIDNNPSMAGNTPEDDARPGVYYFNLGASAFLHKDYVHAISMYEVAASWAYKPAAYNLAVMYARGQGVAVDMPRAMAWIALAAERNDQQYVDTRELIYSLLSKEQFEQANALWRDLKKTYGDDVAMPRAKARWAEVRSGMTGSRVGSTAAPLAVGIPSPHVAQLPPPPNAGGPTRVNTTAADMIRGDKTDGSIAYAQFHESENPYDPKFERPALGTATVGPLIPAKEGTQSKSEESAPQR
jgi:hypothetical protein